MPPPPALPAGRFSSWLANTRRALATGTGAVVACGVCRACCTSSYFIHIGPTESRAVARIPKKLLFPAPGLPQGHKVLGYDEKGHCPMFRDNQCSIYADRPQTCRDYDCRVLAAAGMTEEDKPFISLQAQRWKFDLFTEQDHQEMKAVRAAAEFITKNAGLFPAEFIPLHATQQAVLAVKIYPVFLAHLPAKDETAFAAQRPVLVAEIVAAFERFSHTTG